MNKVTILTLIPIVALFFLSGYTDKEGSGKIENNTERLNPFLTKEEERLFRSSKPRIPINHLNLTAIFYSPDNKKSRIVIDGRILKKNQVVDNKEIIEIQPEVVILKDSQGEYIMRLKRAQGQQ